MEAGGRSGACMPRPPLAPLATPPRGARAGFAPAGCVSATFAGTGLPVRGVLAATPVL